MFAIKNFFHDLAIAIARVFMKLLPDKIPVTFIGPDASRELCESIAHISTDPSTTPSSTKILIVTDTTLVEIGLVGRITGSLDSLGLNWSIFAGVEPDPTFAQVEA